MSHSAQRLQQCFKALESDLAKSFEHTKEQPSGSRDRATNPLTQFSKQKDGALHHVRHEVGSDKAPFDQVHLCDVVKSNWFDRLNGNDEMFFMYHSIKKSHVVSTNYLPKKQS
jgi:hypothetical protein